MTSDKKKTGKPALKEVKAAAPQKDTAMPKLKPGAKPLAPAEVTGELLPAKAPQSLRDEQAAGHQMLALHEKQLNDLKTQVLGTTQYDFDVLAGRSLSLIHAAEHLKLEAGKILLVLREVEGPGVFWGKVAVGDPAARKYIEKLITTAHRFCTGKFADKQAEVARLGGKVFELLSLDDDQRTTLLDGESVFGMTLDDIDRMSPSEVRKKLREARKEAEAKAKAAEKMLEDRQGRIDRLEHDLAVRAGYAPDQLEAERLEREKAYIEKIHAVALESIESVRKLAMTINAAMDDDSPSLTTREFAAKMTAYVFNLINEISVEHGMSIQFTDVVDDPLHSLPGLHRAVPN